MRIATVLLRDEMQGQRHEIDSQRAEAEAMIEQQCAQLDADSCKAMREMMMGALAMSSAMLEGLDRIPPPSAAEAALLERYANELRQVVGD